MFVEASSFLVALVASVTLAAGSPVETRTQWVGDTKARVESSLPIAHQPPPGRALVVLARQMLGRPYSAFSLDALPAERLRLDLTSFDCVLLIEQLLALIHSRTLMEFPDQVRRLRYDNGQVDYCQRNHYFSRWAQNAEHHGLLQDITPTLPGASTRVRKLTFMSSHPGSYKPMRQERYRHCISQLEQSLVVNQAYVPLSALSHAVAGLKNGDIFTLVTAINGLDVTHAGILERTATGLNAIHAVPERGVIRSYNFVGYVSAVEDVVGVSFYRPLSPWRSKQSPQPKGRH
jgi:hypothetical protein